MLSYAPLGSNDRETNEEERGRRTQNQQLLIGILIIALVIVGAGGFVSIFDGDGPDEGYKPEIELFRGLYWPPESAIDLGRSSTVSSALNKPATTAAPINDDTQRVVKQDNRPFMRDPKEYILQRNWDFTQPKQVREYDWTISDADISPDGVLRPMLLINGQFPGPTIEVMTGDTIRVNIFNNASNATAFHWHGMFLHGTPWLDGTVGLTQCPIQPGRNFTYEFGTSGQWGTYWYHSHIQAQYIDGLFGPLIIHSPDEPASKLDYDTDQVIMLHDHYYDLSGALLPEYLAPDNENAEPIPDAALLNGRNVKDCSQVEDRYTCDNSTATISAMTLMPDRKHRLRFINVGGFAEFEVQIDNHPFPIVEIDGTSTNSTNFQKMRINVAQRYSIILSPPSTTTADSFDNSFWLRARMIEHCFAHPKPRLNTEVRAVIHYSTDLTLTPPIPSSSPWNDEISLICSDLNSTNVVPAIDNDKPPPPKDLFYLRSNFEIGAGRLSRGFFNTSSWITPKVPTLEYIMNGTLGYLAADGKDVTKGMLLAPEEHIIDVLIDNFDDGNHPFHLHGYKFWVMAQGNGYFNRSDYGSLPITNILKRDTVTIGAFGWILIRFYANNPGLWAFHCHNVWHGEAGLMMAFLTAEEDLKGHRHTYTKMDALCYA